MNHFSFLEREWPGIFEAANRAERAVYPDPRAAWGGINKKKSGRLLDGRTWDALPRVFTPLPKRTTERARSTHDAAERPALALWPSHEKIPA
jgi:hypothetical protein